MRHSLEVASCLKQSQETAYAPTSDPHHHFMSYRRGKYAANQTDISISTPISETLKMGNSVGHGLSEVWPAVHTRRHSLEHTSSMCNSPNPEMMQWPPEEYGEQMVAHAVNATQQRRGENHGYMRQWR